MANAQLGQLSNSQFSLIMMIWFNYTKLVLDLDLVHFYAIFTVRPHCLQCRAL